MGVETIEDDGEQTSEKVAVPSMDELYDDRDDWEENVDDQEDVADDRDGDQLEDDQGEGGGPGVIAVAVVFTVVGWIWLQITEDEQKSGVEEVLG